MTEVSACDFGTWSFGFPFTQETRTARHLFSDASLFPISIQLELELERELDHACRFTGLDNGLRRRRRHRAAAGRSKVSRPDAGRTGRGIPRIVKVRMIECIEHLHPKLHLEPFRHLKHL